MVQGVSRGDTEGELLPSQESVYHGGHREAGQPRSLEDVSVNAHYSKVRTTYPQVFSSLFSDGYYCSVCANVTLRETVCIVLML